MGCLKLGYELLLSRTYALFGLLGSGLCGVALTMTGCGVLEAVLPVTPCSPYSRCA